MSLKFLRQIRQWVGEEQNRQEAIIQIATLNMLMDAQRPKYAGGRMPILTGFLRESFYCIVGGVRYEGAEAYLQAVHAMKVGGRFTFGWSAHYAVHREYGTRWHPPDFFLRGALQRWREFVREAKAMVR